MVLCDTTDFTTVLKQKDEMELFQKKSIKEKGVELKENCESIPNLHELMMGYPELRTQVFNIVNSYFVSNQSNGIPSSETTNSGCDGGLKVEADQTQVVMFPSSLPQSRPNYAMNNVTLNKHTSPVAVPAEHMSHPPSTDITVTEETANTDYTDQHQTVSSINMTLSAEQINLCKKAKAFPNITETGKTICSEQSGFQLEDSNACNNAELYAFCDKMNSPDYTAFEGLDNRFENSTFQPSCSQEWEESSEMSDITIPATDSLCGDSDFEVDDMEKWNRLQDLKNLLSAYCNEAVQSTTTTASSKVVMHPTTFTTNINFVENSNVMDVDADKCPSMESENSNHLGSCSPLSTISSTYDVVEKDIMDNTCGPDSQQYESRLIDCDDYDESSRKRQKIDGSQILLEQTSDTHTFNTVVCNELVNQEDCKRLQNHPVFRIDKDGDLHLHVSVAKEDLETTKKLLDIMDGVNLDTQNRRKQTALHLAAYTGNVPITKSLLQAGANPEIEDSDGNNILHIACEKGSTEMLDALFECVYMKGPCKLVEMLNMWNNEGLAPLHIAYRQKDVNIINYLAVKFNCNLDIKEMKSGSTVLVCAFKDCEWELGRHFITYGADVNVPTNAGNYPLDYVGISDNLDLAKELILRNAVSGVKIDFPNDKMKCLFECELRKRRRKRTRDARND